jgi:hypothetical protein
MAVGGQVSYADILTPQVIDQLPQQASAIDQ